MRLPAAAEREDRADSDTPRVAAGSSRANNTTPLPQTVTRAVATSILRPSPAGPVLPPKSTAPYRAARTAAGLPRISGRMTVEPGR